MAERWTLSITLPRTAAVRFLAGWAVLNTLPMLPPLLTPLPLSPYAPLCVEVLVLVTGLVYAAGTPWERTARRGVLAGLAVLIAYQAYDAAVYTAFQRSGILYEDLQFADNLAYFAADIATWTNVAMGVGGLAVVCGLAILAWWAAQAVAKGGVYGGGRTLLLAAHLVAWPLVLVVGPAQEWGVENLTYQTSNERVRVRTITTRAWANARASMRLAAMLDSLATAPADSAYAAYKTLRLRRPPSVYLFAVESYGTLLDRHPDLRAPYRRLMRRTEAALRDDNWHMATARAEAPVRGGRSWLALASILTGVRVNRQLLFNRFRERADRVPHLIHFLDRQGYHTVALQPFTYARPGLPVHNLYDFDVTLYRDDLNYKGPPYGLANAPDQYSLNFAHETQLAGRSPFFLFFETVDSHALWNYGLPPVLPDWRRFNTVTGSKQEQRRVLAEEGHSPGPFLPDSLTAPRIYDQPQDVRYLRHIAYDLQVIRDYLIEKAPPGSLVLLLGDHQPPLFGTKSAAVPLHVLSTDAAFVERVRRRGFADGLTLEGSSVPTVRQEALYSLLVRLLAAHDPPSGTAVPLPPVRPQGGSPSLLVASPSNRGP